MRSKFLNKAFLVVGLAVLMCGLSMQASATTFNFQESAGFLVGGTNLVSNGGTPYDDIKWYQLPSVAPQVAPPAGEYNTIAWGASNDAGALMGSNPWYDSNYSGLRILGQQGSVTTGNWVTITQLYHQNNSISSNFNTLVAATISSVLYIGAPPSYSDLKTDPNSIPITFNETLNSGTCAGPSGLGTCPDYFGFNAGVGFAPLTFTYGGQLYEVDFKLLPGTGSNVEYLLTDGVPNGNIRIWTTEGGTSRADVQMMISAVPEPATLALLGLGLLGLGLAARRRKG